MLFLLLILVTLEMVTDLKVKTYIFCMISKAHFLPHYCGYAKITFIFKRFSPKDTTFEITNSVLLFPVLISVVFL